MSPITEDNNSSETRTVEVEMGVRDAASIAILTLLPLMIMVVYWSSGVRMAVAAVCVALAASILDRPKWIRPRTAVSSAFAVVLPAVSVFGTAWAIVGAAIYGILLVLGAMAVAHMYAAKADASGVKLLLAPLILGAIVLAGPTWPLAVLSMCTATIVVDNYQHLKRRLADPGYLEGPDDYSDGRGDGPRYRIRSISCRAHRAPNAASDTA